MHKTSVTNLFFGNHIYIYIYIYYTYIYIYVLSILYLMPSQMVLDLPNHTEITFSGQVVGSTGDVFFPKHRAAFERET